MRELPRDARPTPSCARPRGSSRSSVHRDDRIGCVGCHKGDPRDPTVGAHARAPASTPHPTHAEVPGICGELPQRRRVHAASSTRASPSGRRRSTDLSLHGKLTAAGDADAPNCAELPRQARHRLARRRRRVAGEPRQRRRSSAAAATPTRSGWRKYHDPDRPVREVGAERPRPGVPRGQPERADVHRLPRRALRGAARAVVASRAPAAAATRTRSVLRAEPALARASASAASRSASPATATTTSRPRRALIVGTTPDATCMKCHSQDDKPREVAGDIARCSRGARARGRGRARRRRRARTTRGLHVAGARLRARSARDGGAPGCARVVHTLDPGARRGRAVAAVDAAADEAMQLVADARAARRTRAARLLRRARARRAALRHARAQGPRSSTGGGGEAAMNARDDAAPGPPRLARERRRARRLLAVLALLVAVVAFRTRAARRAGAGVLRGVVPRERARGRRARTRAAHAGLECQACHATPQASRRSSALAVARRPKIARRSTARSKPRRARRCHDVAPAEWRLVAETAGPPRAPRREGRRLPLVPRRDAHGEAPPRRSASSCHKDQRLHKTDDRRRRDVPLVPQLRRRRRERAQPPTTLACEKCHADPARLPASRGGEPSRADEARRTTTRSTAASPASSATTRTARSPRRRRGPARVRALPPVRELPGRHEEQEAAPRATATARAATSRTRRSKSALEGVRGAATRRTRARRSSRCSRPGTARPRSSTRRARAATCRTRGRPSAAAACSATRTRRSSS